MDNHHCSSPPRGHREDPFNSRGDIQTGKDGWPEKPLIEFYVRNEKNDDRETIKTQRIIIIINLFVFTCFVCLFGLLLDSWSRLRTQEETGSVRFSYTMNTCLYIVDYSITLPRGLMAWHLPCIRQHPHTTEEEEAEPTTVDG